MRIPPEGRPKTTLWSARLHCRRRARYVIVVESTLELPRAVGTYTLTRYLGKGGMGVVYAARDDRLGREVAVKMIAGLSSDDAVKRFWREARAAAAISHPNICQIYEVDESKDGIYLAMELLEGEALDAR